MKAILFLMVGMLIFFSCDKKDETLTGSAIVEPKDTLDVTEPKDSITEPSDTITNPFDTITYNCLKVFGSKIFCSHDTAFEEFAIDSFCEYKISHYWSGPNYCDRNCGFTIKGKGQRIIKGSYNKEYLINDEIFFHFRLPLAPGQMTTKAFINNDLDSVCGKHILHAWKSDPFIKHGGIQHEYQDDFNLKDPYPFNEDVILNIQKSKDIPMYTITFEAKIVDHKMRSADIIFRFKGKFKPM